MHKIVNQFNAFKLNEYRETFEIVSGYDSDGTFKPSWAIASKYDPDAGSGVPVTKEDGSYRNVPIKVVLGNRKEAIENLEWLLGELEKHETVPPANTGDGTPMSDNVPF